MVRSAHMLRLPLQMYLRTVALVVRGLRRGARNVGAGFLVFVFRRGARRSARIRGVSSPLRRGLGFALRCSEHLFDEAATLKEFCAASLKCGTTNQNFFFGIIRDLFLLVLISSDLL